MRRRLQLPLRTPRRIRADADAELESLLAERTEWLMARGLSPADAEREALRRLAGTSGESFDVIRRRLQRSAEHRERRMRSRDRFDTMQQDVRFAVRALRRAPGFAAIAALTLALGIGASTAIFSAVHPILLAPLPYHEASRIVMLWDRLPDGSRFEPTYGTYRELAERSRSFMALAAIRPWQPTLTDGEEPERLQGQRVSSSYFRTLGVLPAMGRDLLAADEQVGAPRVVLLSDGIWRRRFGADPAVVGREITLDEERFTVVGVMPRALEDVLAPGTEIWTPFQYPAVMPLEGSGWGHNLRIVGRLRAGTSRHDAERELATIGRSPVAEFARPPWAAMENGLTLTRLQDDVTRGARPVLLAVLGGALLVLVIACVNVTNLLLARGAQRRGELAMRTALGAGRGRLVRQLLTESLVLGALAGTLGVVLAAAGIRALVAVAPPELPRAAAIGLDGAALAFALGITTLVTLAVGLLPALQLSARAAPDSIDRASRRTAGSRDVTRAGLVVAEVALALVLLVGAGLLWRSTERLLAVEPGFEPARLLTMQVQSSGRQFDEDVRVHTFFREALELVRALPGVTTAAWTSALPLSGDGETYGVHFEASAPGGENTDGDVFRYAVSPGYLEAMEIPLIRGRYLSADDVRGAPLAVVINASFAARRFPGQDPVGQKLRIGPADGPAYTIVGIVGDVTQLSLATANTRAVYITTEQSWFADRVLTLVVRTDGDAASLVPAVKRTIWSVDRNQPIERVTTMDELVAGSAAQQRFVLTLFQTFGATALLLAAVGIYGVLAGSVAERVREIGVRTALGASRGAILRLIVGRGAALTALGALVGICVAVVASNALATLLFGVSRLDPLTYASVVLLLLVSAVVACALPAWRAVRIDPAVALRAD